MLRSLTRCSATQEDSVKTTWSIPPAAARTHLHQITLLWSRKGGWKAAITPGPWALKFQARPSQWKTPAKSSKKDERFTNMEIHNSRMQSVRTRLASPNTCSEGFSDLAISATWPSKKKRVEATEVHQPSCHEEGIQHAPGEEFQLSIMPKCLGTIWRTIWMNFHDLPSGNKLILGHLPR